MPTMETVEQDDNLDQDSASGQDQSAPGLHADAHPNANPSQEVYESELTDEQRYAQIFAIISHRHSEVEEEDKETFFKRMEELRKAMSHSGESFLNFKALLDTAPLPQKNKNNPTCHSTDLLHALLKHSQSINVVNGIALMKSGGGHNGHIAITGSKVEYIKALDDKGAPAVFGMEDAYRMVLMAANNSYILNSGKGMKINGSIRERALIEKAINDVNQYLPESRQIRVANRINNVQYRMHTFMVSQDIRSLVGDDLYITEPRRSFPDKTILDSAAAEFAPPTPAAEEPATAQEQAPTNQDQNEAEPESASAESSEESDFAFDIEEPAPSQSVEPTETENADAPSEDELTANATPTPEAAESEIVDEPTADESPSEELDRVASLRKESSDIQDESLALSEAIEKENEFESMRHDLIMLGKEIAQSRDEDKVQQYTDLADDFLFRMSDDIRSNAVDLEIFDRNNVNIHEYRPSPVFGINDTAYYVVPNGDNFKLIGFQVNGQQFELDGGRGFFNYMEKYKPVLDVERYMAENADSLSEISRQVGTVSDGRPVFSYAAELTEEHPDDLHEYLYIYDDNNIARLLRIFKNGVETDNIHPDIPVQFATEKPVMASDAVFSSMESALGVAPQAQDAEQAQDVEAETAPVVDEPAAPVIDEPAEEQPAAEEIDNANAESSAQKYAFVPENMTEVPPIMPQDRPAEDDEILSADSPVDRSGKTVSSVEEPESAIADEQNINAAYQPEIWAVHPHFATSYTMPFANDSVPPSETQANQDTPIATASAHVMEEQDIEATPAVEEPPHAAPVEATDHSARQVVESTPAVISTQNKDDAEYIWARDNVLLPFHDHFKNKKVADLVDEINRTLEGRHALLTISNDNLIERLKEDRLLLTKSMKTGEKIAKISTFAKYSEEYQTIVESFVNNRSAWLNKGFDSFEQMVAKLRHTTVDELDPVVGAKPWALWQRLSRDGVITVDGKGKAAVILDVADGLRNVKHFSLRNSFAAAAAMPAPTPEVTHNLKPESGVIGNRRPAHNYAQMDGVIPAERHDFTVAADKSAATPGLDSADDDDIAPPIGRPMEERLNTTDHLPRYAAE